MEQTVRLMHRHQPRPRDGLLSAVTEVGLIRRRHGHRASVRPFLMCLNGTFCRNPRSVFHHGGVVRIRRVVLRTKHQSSYFVPWIRWLPTHEWAIRWIRITVDIVTIIDSKIFTEERVHMNLPLTNSRRSLIHSVRITKVVVPDHVPVSRRPGAVRCVPGLRCDTVESITLLPQEVLGRSYCGPWLLDVTNVTEIRILLVFRNPVIIRTDVRVG